MIEIPELISQDLELINNVAKDLQMKLYVVGGLPRDIIFGAEVNDDTDLDVTEANGNAFDLAFFVAAKYDLMEPQIYEASGTAMVIMPSKRRVEFHNAYYNVPHIIDQLYSIGIEPSPLNKDVYARDFTINTLLLDPTSGEILDITGKGIEDIKKRYLRTPLSPEKSLMIDHRRILRGIRFKIQFGLKVDPQYDKVVFEFLPKLKKFLQDNPNSQMVRTTVDKTFALNKEKAMEEYNKLGILEYLPKGKDMDSVVKEQLFGTTITPTGLGKDESIEDFASNDAIIITSQTGFIQHLMSERDRHKNYVERKKRELKKRREEKFEILEKADEGFFSGNNITPEKNKKKKSMGQPGREFVPKKRHL